MKNYFFILSGILLLIGAITFLTRWYYAPYVYAFGAAGVAISFMTTQYQGLNFRERRLHRINVIATVMILVSSFFMFRSNTGWVVFLLIAALLMLYTSSINTAKKDEKDGK
ncbi:MAG: hypothetical protein LBN11_06540 [Tannerella sp.]|jgi:TRAP-type uncharacterized transport system fused permease subunit|nr:hypothetical protein [Tannerella sp.]